MDNFGFNYGIIYGRFHQKIYFYNLFLSLNKRQTNEGET